jgi:hypothetical protein
MSGEKAEVEKPFPTSIDNIDSESAMVSTPRKVKISLKNTPPGTLIMLGERIITGSTLEVEKGNEKISFTVSAEGHEPREIEVVPSEDMTVDGKLEPTGAAKIKKGQETATSLKKGANPVETGAKEKGVPTKKKKPIDLDWESYPGLQ